MEEIKQNINIKNMQVRINRNIYFDIIKKCGTTTVSIYIALMSHKNKQYNTCYPSIKIISDETNLSESTVKRSISNLVKNGYLFVDSGCFKKNSHYYFLKEPGLYTEEAKEKINELMKKHKYKDNTIKKGETEENA